MASTYDKILIILFLNETYFFSASPLKNFKACFRCISVSEEIKSDKASTSNKFNFVIFVS